MMEELKPCPCCGHPAEIWEDCDDAGITFYNVGCSHCTIGTDWLYKRDDCISHWNARRESGEFPEWVKEAIDNEMLGHIAARTKYNGIRAVIHDSKIKALEWVLSLRKPEEME